MRRIPSCPNHMPARRHITYGMACSCTQSSSRRPSRGCDLCCRCARCCRCALVKIASLPQTALQLTPPYRHARKRRASRSTPRCPADAAPEMRLTAAGVSAFPVTRPSGPPPRATGYRRCFCHYPPSPRWHSSWQQSVRDVSCVPLCSSHLEGPLARTTLPVTTLPAAGSAETRLQSKET